MTPTPVMTDDERYAAIRARDTRFDGMFFTCVRSTGIFCRPSCPARTPQRGVVEFAPSAAAAVAGGFRACKRCGPTAPPGSPDDDPMGSLSGRALRLIDEGALDDEGTVPDLAQRLAVSERTLHRALVAVTGAGALAHARMRRARRAHELVIGSALPLAQVAHASGFGSERQFHDTFTQLFGHSPSTVRERSSRRPGGSSRAADGGSVVTAQLAVRRPFDGAGLASWFAHRAVPGVEDVSGSVWTRAVRLPHGPGVLQVNLGAEGALPVDMRLADLRDHAAAISLVRRLLDLDADPVGIDGGLATSVPALAPLVSARPGVRLPGTPTLAEALLWAITGQQITTSQAREQITRATDLLSEELPEDLHLAGVHRAPVDPGLAAVHAEEWFRGPSARRRTLISAVGAVTSESRSLDLDASRPVDELRADLLALHGIGPWTADYVLLRGVRAIDVAPARDVALLGAARDIGLAADHAALQQALAAAAPWRSYASMHLWHHQASLRRGAASPVVALPASPPPLGRTLVMTDIRPAPPTGTPALAPGAGAGAEPQPATTPVAPRHRRVATPLGTYLIAAEADSLTGVWRMEQSHFPRPERLGAEAGPEDALMGAAEEQLLAYLAGERTSFDLPISPHGTPFQHAVWDRLQEIPRGATTTYGRIAQDLGRPRAAQAVGAAVGSNPISIVVPCHRVVATNGALTGYAGGIETKQALLVLEGALLA